MKENNKIISNLYKSTIDFRYNFDCSKVLCTSCKYKGICDKVDLLFIELLEENSKELEGVLNNEI
ncbi:MAG: hypothetical protein ACRDBY_14060 [Cetobacterium sp.]